jgi:hypothetical protein
MTVTRMVAVEPLAHCSVTVKFAVASASNRWNVSTAAVADAGTISAAAAATSHSVVRQTRRKDVVDMVEDPFLVDR